MLRSGYPPCAAVSLVVLSPTKEGRVCDIQLVIIAMVLSTTPIFSKGTDIFCALLLTFSSSSSFLFKSSSFYRLQGETREASRGAQSISVFHPGLRLGCSFFGHFHGSSGGRARLGGSGRRAKLHGAIRCTDKVRGGGLKAAAGDVLWIAPLPALSRTLPPLRFAVTISFTPDGPPPALLRSVIKCH